MSKITPKRALLSVSDKTGIVAFAKALHQLGVELVSTGGTANALRQANIPVIEASELTAFPEMMGGRLKTLHPKIFGGILAKRDEHATEVTEHNLPLIDLVVCNLYPFAETVAKPDVTEAKAIENIDIGGPSMVRAAAKNFAWTSIIVDPNDYDPVIDEIKQQGVSLATRKQLAIKAFGHTAQYDCMIHSYLNDDAFPEELTLSFKKSQQLRYGENPHQAACVYSDGTPGILQASLLQGKPLSYNNIADGDAAFMCVNEFPEPACVVVKHANPCGVAVSDSIDTAFTHAWEADSKSAFGGIVALNRPCTKAIAEFLTTVFFEVLIAPDYDSEALALFNTKKNVRLLKLPINPAENHLLKSVSGGLLVQTPDLHNVSADTLNCVTENKPDAATVNDLLFAWRTVKHVKSNAILIAKTQTTLGIGAGQVSRVDAVKIAVEKASTAIKGAVLASDAFFPFRDSIDLLASTGIKAIIQPGGSIRDEEVIAACNDYGIAMVFTGARCFKH